MENRHWFKAKRYGWGWTPATWEGWLVTLVYAGLMVWSFVGIYVQPAHPGFGFIFGTLVPALIATSTMILICYRTGEKPEWRWGDKK